MRRSVRASTRAGLSLLEVTIALSLAAVVMLTASSAAIESYDAYKSASVNSSTEARVRQAVHRTARVLASSGLDVIFPPNIDDEFGTADLVFQQAIGVDVANQQPLWNPELMRLVLEYDRGEVDDGVDNDNDGLVDECTLVLLRDDGGPGEIRVVLCQNVREFLEGEEENGVDDNGNGIRDERGFNIHRSGNILTVRLSVEEPSEQTGTVVRTLTATVRMRN